MPEGKRIGVVFHHLPEAVYEGGATKRINRLEAERVVEAIVVHMRDHMDESLMVAAMNKPQADLIYSLLSIHERTSPELFARFQSRHPHEPLDVKNLENVQGDERDVVFISVTYGRDASGAVLQRFGPLLSEGGERRLNVLISRSRRRCEVFSSLTADDIRVEGVRPGLQAFKNYLHFAQRGQMPYFAPTGEEAESPFEEEVIEALRERGFEVDSQVGSEGYRIDLAVVDPANPGSYLVGVECDGVTYHSARSARDRDKLRQRVLEQRGWKLHRIWSCDWWQDRDGEIDRLLRAIAGAEQLRMDEEPPISVELVDEDQRAPVRAVRPYVGAPAFVGLPADASLLQYGKEVVEIEGPIHHELLLARMCVALGSARLTRGVRAHLEGLIARLGQTGQIRRLLDAYVVSDSQSAEPRNWSDRPPDEKLSDLVPQVEIAAALRAVVDEAFGISREDAVRGALAMLGFRATSNARDRTAQVLQKMVEGGAVVEDKEVLRPAAWIRSR
jgi:very-short-patch-repair endonuclease